MQHFDVVVIGGGINGAAVARDAAGRGLRVLLAERDDYAGATSSASSKLIHGGLRYLEHRAFDLVRESLHERETLLATAPHLVSPLTFLIPIRRGLSRPAWKLWAGLKLYDWYAGSRRLDRSAWLARAERGGIPHLRADGLRGVLRYADATADDTRLTLANLLDARARGADIANRREVVTLAPAENGYRVKLAEGGARREVEARFVVNAAGPWAGAVDALLGRDQPTRPLRLVRGSHLVLAMPEPALTAALTLQAADGRVVFALPWLDARFLLLGTTDVPQSEPAETAVCTKAEETYLLDVYNSYVAHPGGPAGTKDVVWRWSGVRALVDDGAAEPAQVSREAAVLTTPRGTGGFVTLYGGKLTTHRALAEEALRAITQLGADIGPSWTATAPLYGGERSRDGLLEYAKAGPVTVHSAVRRRWALTYGTLMEALFERIRSVPELAREAAPGIPEAELLHAWEEEDARTGEDFMLRRSKTYPTLTARHRRAINRWFRARAAPPPAPSEAS